MSDSINDGGPAFPLHLPAIMGEPDTYWNGMSLRDYFAGHALAGLLTQSAGDVVYEWNIAKASYEIANEMLDARKEVAQ